MTAATEEEIEEAATVGDGGSARANCRGRGNGRDGEKGSQRGRDGLSRPEGVEDLDALSDSEIANGKDVAEEQSGGRRHVDNSEDGNGEDGRRSRRVGEEETEREGRRSSSDTVAPVNGGSRERREGRELASRIKPRQPRQQYLERGPAVVEGKGEDRGRRRRRSRMKGGGRQVRTWQSRRRIGKRQRPHSAKEEEGKRGGGRREEKEGSGRGGEGKSWGGKAEILESEEKVRFFFLLFVFGRRKTQGITTALK